MNRVAATLLPHVYDTSGKLEGLVTDSYDAHIQDALLTDTEGQEVLDFSIPLKSPSIASGLLKNERYIAFGGSVFQIRTVQAGYDQSDNWAINVHCEAAWYDLGASPPVPAMTLYPAPFGINSFITSIVQTALEGTGWGVGVIEPNIQYAAYTNDAGISALACLQLLPAAFGGELEFDSVNKLVNLRNQRGVTTQLLYARRKNSSNDQITVDTTNFYTRVYPTGANGIDITSVNGGVDYIEDNSWFTDLGEPPVTRSISINNDTLTTPDAVLSWAQGQLALYSRPSMAYTLSVALLKTDVVPNLGDTVRVWDDVMHVNANARVVSRDWYPIEPDRSVITINRQSANLAQQLATGGGTSSTGNKNPKSDTMAPEPPSSVTVQASAVLDDNGRPMAEMTVSWAQVTTNTDGTAIADLSGYQVVWQYHGGGVSPPYEVTSADTSIFIADLKLGVKVTAFVRAFDTSGNLSGWASSALTQLPSATAPLPKPSTPALDGSTFENMVRATWDGLTATGTQEVTGTDFDHLEVHVSTNAADDFTAASTLVDNMLGPGSTAIPGIAGQTVYVAFVAVDILGQKSPVSNVASAVITSGASDAMPPGDVSGVAIASRVVTDVAGTPSAVATVSWAQLAQNQDGTALADLADYVVQWRYTGSPNWSQSIYVDATTTQVDIPGLTPNVSIDVRVKGEDRTGNLSPDWATATGTTTRDIAAPNVPSTPTTDNTSFLTLIRATWDGNDSASVAMVNAGGAPVADFDHLEVYASSTNPPAVTPANLVGQMLAPGSVPVTPPQSNPTATMYIGFAAVDTSGNRSGLSTVVSAAPQQLPDTGVASMSVGKLLAGQLTASFISLGGFLTTNPPTATAPFTPLRTGARMELDAAGLRLYDGNGAALVNLASNGSATFAGALSGATGTFQGSLSAAGGTFSGDISAASGHFTGQVDVSKLQAGQLTTGFISLGGFLTTNPPTATAPFTPLRTGARLELDSAGLRVYDGNGNVVTNLSADGAVTFAGDITGASGAFTGTLSGVTGTFSSISGQIVRTATSGNLAGLTNVGTTGYLYFQNGAAGSGNAQMHAWNLGSSYNLYVVNGYSGNDRTDAIATFVLSNSTLAGTYTVFKMLALPTAGLLGYADNQISRRTQLMVDSTVATGATSYSAHFRAQKAKTHRDTPVDALNAVRSLRFKLEDETGRYHLYHKDVYKAIPHAHGAVGLAEHHMPTEVMDGDYGICYDQVNLMTLHALQELADQHDELVRELREGGALSGAR